MQFVACKWVKRKDESGISKTCFFHSHLGCTYMSSPLQEIGGSLSAPSSPSSSIEENTNHNIDTLPLDNIPIIILISHAHSPPLNPSPNLSFDVRHLGNPPKNIRDRYDGTSKRLQDWLDSSPEFRERREVIKQEIVKGMLQRLEEVSSTEDNGPSKDVADKALTESDHNEERDEGEQDNVQFRIGVFCEKGKHRSVAMVEQLRKLDWPGWNVEVEHRDVLKKKGESGMGKKGGGKGSRGTRGGGMAETYDEQEA